MSHHTHTGNCCGPEEHKFWNTQPVIRAGAPVVAEVGPIEEMKLENVRTAEYPLPEGFEWTTEDLQDEASLTQVYTLLTENYVEDAEAMFRFDYSAAFLQWALLSPGFIKEWHVGVRAKTSGKLLAFISAIPATMVFADSEVKTAEVNFLCVHKKLRTKRLAPVLIKEITRRVNRCEIWQAVYTAGIVFPTPVGSARYWHRSLQFKKLVDIGFSGVPPNSTMARQIRLLKLAEEHSRSFIPMEQRHVKQVTVLLCEYLKKFAYRPDLTASEVSHWLLPRTSVVYSYVLENSKNQVTDFFSFYSLPSSVLRFENTKLMAAYCYYAVGTTMSVTDLMREALIAAKNTGFDVFNALEIMDNAEFLQELRFGRGDGNLQYYVYNWYMPKIEPNQIGLILL